MGLDLSLSETVDISTETCVKGCDEGGWDLQLQNTAVSPLCCVWGLGVHAAGCGRGDVQFLPAQASVSEKQDGGASFAPVTTVSLPPQASATASSGVPAHPRRPPQACLGMLFSTAPGEAPSVGTALPGIASNLRLWALLLQH